MSTDKFDFRTCPYCGNTRTGVKKSEPVRSVQRQTKYCPQCKGTWYIDWRNHEIAYVSDNNGNRIFTAPKKKG